jgi:hypothetical protein
MIRGYYSRFYFKCYLSLSTFICTDSLYFGATSNIVFISEQTLNFKVRYSCGKVKNKGEQPCPRFLQVSADYVCAFFLLKVAALVHIISIGIYSVTRAELNVSFFCFVFW